MARSHYFHLFWACGISWKLSSSQVWLVHPKAAQFLTTSATAADDLDRHVVGLTGTRGSGQAKTEQDRCLQGRQQSWQCPPSLVPQKQSSPLTLFWDLAIFWEHKLLVTFSGAAVLTLGNVILAMAQVSCSFSWSDQPGLNWMIFSSCPSSGTVI